MSWPTIVSEKIKQLTTQDSRSDVTLIVGEKPNKKQFKSHRLVLSLFSDVFKAMFYGPLAEMKEEVQFPEDDPNTFERMIKYIYTGDEETENIERIKNLYHLGDKYLCTDLKSKCINKMQNKISYESVIQIYETATELMEHKLRIKCWEYILDNTTEVLEADSFINAKTSTIESIITKSYINVDSELVVYNAVSRWGQVQCLREEKEMNSSNVRQVIDPLLPSIRFLAMTEKEFFQGPGKDKIFTETEQLSILNSIALKVKLEKLKLNNNEKRKNRDESVTSFSSEGSKKMSHLSFFPTIKQLSKPLPYDIYVYGVSFYLSTTTQYFASPNIKECTLTICNVDRDIKVSKTFKKFECYKEDCRLNLDEAFFVAKNEKCEITLTGENSQYQTLYCCRGDCRLRVFGKSDFHFHQIFVHCM